MHQPTSQKWHPWQTSLWNVKLSVDPQVAALQCESTVLISHTINDYTGARATRPLQQPFTFLDVTFVGLWFSLAHGTVNLPLPPPSLPRTPGAEPPSPISTRERTDEIHSGVSTCDSENAAVGFCRQTTSHDLGLDSRIADRARRRRSSASSSPPVPRSGISPHLRQEHQRGLCFRPTWTLITQPLSR